MQELIDALIGWLRADPNRAKANKVALALATETRKVLASADAEQREFDALDLAMAAESETQWDFDRAKRWITNSGFERYLAVRQTDLEQHFHNAELTRCLKVEKVSPGGKHRAHWRLVPYEIAVSSSADDHATAPDLTAEPPAMDVSPGSVITYECSQPGIVKPSWWVWPILRSGSFQTRSVQGALWAVLIFLAIAEILVCAFLLWSFALQRRPLQAADFAEIAGLSGLIWAVSVYQLRPLLYLVEDRLIPAGDFWVGLGEAPAQLEFAKIEGRRMIRLVRYTSVCPVCSGMVELRYAKGPNRRRIVGCCEEAPYEHVFTFDRVLRQGRRLQ